MAPILWSSEAGIFRVPVLDTPHVYQIEPEFLRYHLAAGIPVSAGSRA
ncbi:MAG: hypothetical protein ACYDHY_00575 [Acidiferrobacterales bacterium]